MKVIGKRKEVITKEFFTLELEKRQLLAIMSALGLTNKHERSSELRSFYNIKDDYVDNGEELYEELLEVLGLAEMFEPDASVNETKTPDSSENDGDFFSNF